MSFVKELRSWYFRTNAPTNARNKKINFNSTGEPDQDLMERFASSVLFFKNIEDRAKQSTGVEANENLVGHVQVATDVEAKANTTGLGASTTKVIHPRQLPTVAATDVDTVADFVDVALAVAVDGTATRNNFLVRLSTNFKVWLADVRTDLNASQVDIADIRTLTATADGAVDLGSFTGTTITSNTTIKNALQELETAVEAIVPGAGDVTNGSNLGGGTVSLFISKIAGVLGFKTISAGTYITITDAANIVTPNVNGAALVAALVEPTYSKELINLGAGAKVYEETTGNVNTPNLRSLVAGSGVVVTENATNITFEVDDAYINALIVASGIPVPSGFLFYSSTTVDLPIPLTSSRFPFPNDSTLGGYDDNNAWAVDEFTCNTEAAAYLFGGDTIDFTFTGVVELTEATIIGVLETLICTVFIKKNGVTIASAFVTFVDANILGDTLLLTVTNVTGPFVLGDIISVELQSARAGTTTATAMLRSGAGFYNGI